MEIGGIPYAHYNIVSTAAAQNLRQERTRSFSDVYEELIQRQGVVTPSLPTEKLRARNNHSKNEEVFGFFNLRRARSLYENNSGSLDSIEVKGGKIDILG